MIAPSQVSTPFCLIWEVWRWNLELLLFVSTPFWVVWEQPLDFLPFSLGCFLLLRPLFIFFTFLDEVVHQLRLYFNLLYVLWIRLILDMDHGALLLPGPKVKLLFFAIDVEADFSSSNINLCSQGAEEWLPKDEGRFLCCLRVQHHEVDWDEVTLDSHWNIFSNPNRIADHGLGQLEYHWRRCKVGEVQLGEDDLGHNAHACPKITQGMIELLGANGACDSGAPRVFLLFWQTVEYSCATLFRQFDNFYGQQWSLVVDDVFDVLCVGRYM